MSTKVGTDGVIYAPLSVTIVSETPPSPTTANPPLCESVPLAYFGIGVAIIVASCIAPIAPRAAIIGIAAGKPNCFIVCKIPPAICIAASAILVAFSNFACFVLNAAFFFSNSAFFCAVLSSAARLRASASSVVIAPFSSKASIREISSSPAFSFASCSASTASIWRS